MSTSGALSDDSGIQDDEEKVEITAAGEAESSNETETVGNALFVMTYDGGKPELEGSLDDRIPIVTPTNEGTEYTTKDNHEK